MKTTPAELRKKMKGVICIVITPFRKDYSLDIDGLKDNLERLMKFGAHGMVLGGSLGECSSMTMDERKLLFKTAVDKVAGRLPVICNASDSYVIRAIELTNYAEEIGADGVMLTAPYYAKASEEGMYRFFKAVNDNTNLGITLYETSRSGNHMTPKFIERVVEIEHVVAMKQGTRDIEELEETIHRVGNKISLICGSEVMSLPCYAMGYVGTTSTSSSFMTEILVKQHNAAMAGDYKKAAEIFFSWAPYRRFMKKAGMPATAKAAMNMMGIAAGPVRLPMIDLNEEQKAELKKILVEMGLM